ncbi:hypothetical protein K7957_15595 [Sphingomonas yunnanensis]|uniref:hypothetical protein n=1 Tax=Sphingomonas yunnanensis TaxID=310400 RepID=UPI001CA70A8A|nr:hypothetical protein [Sphingomonas yunnanensis]MBY9064363.1 hypothetical protein [Sphingomonas yunnanensis]
MVDGDTAVFEVQLPTQWKSRIRLRDDRAVALAAARVGAVAHRVLVSGTVTMHDYETFGSDGEGTFGFSQESLVSADGPGTVLLTWQQGFGGEERTEIDIVGVLNSATGACQATINVRFYEGASEGTTELEDSRSFVSIVPEGRLANFDLRLANDEDDWARVLGSISNSTI